MGWDILSAYPWIGWMGAARNGTAWMGVDWAIMDGGWPMAKGWANGGWPMANGWANGGWPKANGFQEVSYASILLRRFIEASVSYPTRLTVSKIIRQLTICKQKLMSMQSYNIFFIISK